MRARNPTTPMIREVVLTVGAGAALVVSAFQWALGLLEPGRALWQLGMGAAFVALVLIDREARPSLRRWAPVVVAASCCLLIPLFLGDERRPQMLVVTVLTAPLVIALVFFDDFRVVVAATSSGVVAAVLARDGVGLAPHETLEFFAGAVAVNGLAAVCSLGYARQRQADQALELRRAEQLQGAERRQAQVERMALVGQLAAGVAHEINNPLSFVASNVGLVRDQLLGHDALGDERPEQVLAEAQEGLERIKQIVADLRAFARDEADGGRAVHLSDVVQEALRLASVKMPSGAFVECSGLATVPLVKGSHRKLVQVLLNLLVNAADALEEHRVASPRVSVTVRRTELGVAIDVADNGPGLTGEAREHLFEPFFSTKGPGKGTGLGLAMSREMVRAMGGDVRLSPSAAGACFTVDLPIESRRTPHEVPVTEPAAPPTRS